MTAMILASLLPAQAGDGKAAFEAKARRLMSTYRMFRGPVDQRAGYRLPDPADAERKRRDLVMLRAAERFDPRGFDRYYRGLAASYRKEFLAGIRVRVQGDRARNGTMTSKGITMMSGFVNKLVASAPQTLPKEFWTPYPIPPVWKPGMTTPRE